jgi:hypothetical protein
MFKQLLFCLFLLLFISVAAYAQSSNWNNAIDLNVTVNSADRIDLYTDADGNHVIVRKSNQLVYYLFSATGSQIRSSVIDNFSENPRLSRIAGWEGNVYISYKKSGTILTQKSTDAGANWDDLQDITLPNSTSNGLELWTDDNGLHIAYSAYDPNNYEYNTYYRMHPHTQPSNWQDFKKVTDEANVSGGFPSVTTSANRVHVAFTSGDYQDPIYNRDITKTRDRYDGTWQGSQEIFDDAARSMVIATSSKLHGFYYDFVAGIGQWYFNLYYRNRNLGSTNWSTAELLLVNAEPDYSAIDMAVSADDQLQVLYGRYDGVYNVWDDGWGTPYTVTGQYGSYSQRIAANSNDIFLVWNDGSTINLRQRDFAPLAPQNLTATACGTYDPVELNWDANTEADLNQYKIYRASNYSSTPPQSGYDLIATLNAYSGGDPVTSYVDEEVFAYPSSWWVHYKIRAVDLEGHHSSYSEIASYNAVLFRITERNEGKEIKTIITDYFLSQNFPNPFNPITTIQFGLRDSGPVELSIHNLSGQRIATLVNGYLDSGNYQVIWDSKDQKGKEVSSGIYIYQLKAGDRRLVKKMMLIK